MYSYMIDVSVLALYSFHHQYSQGHPLEAYSLGPKTQILLWEWGFEGLQKNASIKGDSIISTDYTYR